MPSCKRFMGKLRDKEEFDSDSEARELVRVEENRQV